MLCATLLVLLIFNSSTQADVDDEDLEKEYYQQIDDYITNGTDAEILHRINLKTRSWLGFDQSQLLCPFCSATADVLIRKRRSGVNRATLKVATVLICNALSLKKMPNVCEGLIELNIDIFIYIIDNRPKLDGRKLCAMVLQNIKCYPEEYKETFSVNIPPKKSDMSTFNNSNGKVLKIVHATDLHYDHFYKIGSNAHCDEPMCCRDIKNDTKEEDKAGLWGAYKCDASFHLINSSFNEITKKAPIDYIYYTGDIVPHDVWKTSIPTNKLAMETMFKLMKTYFPKTRIFPLIGNHEPHPLNTFATKDVPSQFSTQWLFDYLAKQWKDWLPDQALATIKLGGYYTVVPTKGFRIIALNPNVAYIYNWWLLYFHGDIYDQLDWLVKTLKTAEDNNEVVHILSHIVPSDEYMFKHWGFNFRRILERFQSNIKGIFYGHTHYDEFTLYLQKDNLKKGLVVAFNGGSLTTHENVNPNFKIYSVDNANYKVLDYEQWIFDINSAIRRPNSAKWIKLYNFKSAYGVKNLDPNTLLDLVNQMAFTKKISEQYERFKFKRLDEANLTSCKNECHINNLCQIVRNDYFDDRKCKSLTQKYSETNV